MKTVSSVPVLYMFLIFALLLSILVIPGIESRGGGGRGGGFGGGKSVSSGGVRSGSGKKAGLLLTGAGVGVASYAAYTADRRRNYLVDTHANPYNVQESRYSKRRGPGISAAAIIFLILGAIGLGWGIWCFFNVCRPFLQDKAANSWPGSRRDSQSAHLTDVKVHKSDEIPLQDTPSTATPSP